MPPWAAWWRGGDGANWTPPRRILDGALSVLRTGAQWKAMPREYGSGSTVHRRFQRWVEKGGWEAMWRRACRKLLIRWEKKPQNYLALVHFAATLLIWRHLVG